MRSLIGTSLILALTGCGPKTSGGTYTVETATGDSSAAATLQGEADALWEKRGDKAQLQAALAKYELAYYADPSNREVVVQLARGWYFLGDAHETEKATKLETWDTSVVWGKRCMALNNDFTAILEKGDEDEASAVRAATAADVPCMYWMATALGKWAKLNGIAKSLKHLPTVKAFVGTVTEMDPSYFHAAADRYWGAYYAIVPSFAGQDLDKSKVHFDKSIAAAPNYLATKVLMAENLSVKKQDKVQFSKLLNEVIDADPALAADVEPENRIEQVKAKALLATADDLFR
jgi:hypothetical protein